ncbi:NAD(P)/FAD-dependent oxidoreductase [Synechocystis sp. LKSZ1]|uniref:NAD(P)/FAD-dependent oxidoreductase n=1 Tax=Synechocystis sp. LKSZ1 TaxID=3144951 RepID=UPI00336C0D39
MSNASQSTVIVGAGFAGLFTALHLRHRQYGEPIFLMDPQERFVFKPMLYELLTGELPESVVCPQYETLLEHSRITFVQDRVTGIDLQQRQLELASGQRQAFNHLVLTVGASQGYLGTQGAEATAFAFRSREQALALRQHLQDLLRQAQQTTDREHRRQLLTVAIVGAGPAGVEMAATLADLLPSWYAKMGGDIRDIRLCLINHADSILAGDANARLKKEALAALHQRMIPVELLLGIGVKAVYGDHLEYQKKGETDIQSLPAHTTIWTAGTAVNPLIKEIATQLRPENLDRHGQPLVTETLQLPDFDYVFAAGDCVTVQGQPQPALAQIAYQQGAVIAHNIQALSQGRPLKPAQPTLRGTLMKLGLGNGVANLFDKVQIHGKVGDLLRNATYLELLPTPLHNFKATTQWLEEETIHRYHRPQALSPQAVAELRLSAADRRALGWVKTLAVAAPIVFLVAVFLGLQTPSNERQPFRPLPTPVAPTR